MSQFNARLLTPPKEEEEIQPYRAVWRSIIIEYGALFGVTIALFALLNFTSFSFPARFLALVNVAIVLLPVGLWVVFSLLPERRAPRPRERLIAVAIVSALVANAVAYPLIYEFLEVSEWLSLTSASQRIIGYTFTVGIIQETLKYIIVRTMVWDEHLRIRQDTIAYGAASALGYATVLNLHFALSGNPPADTVAARVFGTLAIHIVSSLIMSYALSESYFKNANLLLMPAALALAALVPGLIIPLRAGFTNGTIAPRDLSFVLPRPLYGILFSLAVLVGGLVVIAFFFSTSERQEREILINRDE